MSFTAWILVLAGRRSSAVPSSRTRCAAGRATLFGRGRTWLICFRP